MSGVFGWLGTQATAARPVLDAMTTAAARLDNASFASEAGEGFALAAGGLGATAGVFQHRGLVIALHGHPIWKRGTTRATELAEVAQQFSDAFADRGIDAFANVHGDYALALQDPVRRRLTLAVDRMSVRNIVYTLVADGMIFAPTCDVLTRHPSARAEVDNQAIYNYLYFHMVPGPSTVFRGIARVPPGHVVEYGDGRCIVRPHWQPHFVEDARQPFAALKATFRAGLESAVRDYASAPSCGAFLSGGTDSSTLSGLLGRVSRAPARTFSIGFEAEGYDEMQYARIASRHFATEHHEYYVTPKDVADAIPRVADAYDQPFGNASAVPTLFCARLAREHGMARILGGDGGDELYGGNSRYARQTQFALYESIPAALRHALIEPIAARLPLTGGVALLRKARSYVDQASMPMPDRYESYNLLERLGAANVLEADFLAGVDRQGPLRTLREIYAKSDAKSLINRMLALDFQITLADNDLPKVTRMCELAGIDVAFPMLHDEVIDFSLMLAPDQKLKGMQLRYFFKEALKDFLPPEVITKEKHGFGLPFGVWLQRDAGLRALAGDTLATLRSRRIIRTDFIDSLLGQHVAAHAGYYGTMVWILMMLELWFQRHVPR
jgi:asparagine synthase (glutamine-hydrolysing)